MRTFARAAAIAALAPTIAVTAQAQPPSKLQDRIQDSTNVLRELAGVPDKGIPKAIADKARCVVVIPSFKKGAFLGGVEYGQGLATCYVANKGWSAPAFVQMTGVSFGLQAGAQGTDLVLVGVTEESGQKLLKEKIKLGGDIAVAAGPIGRDSKAETSGLANAGFLTYSRNKGVFAGIDLNGDEVHQNGKDTTAYYGKNTPFETLLNGGARTPAGLRGFVREVSRIFGTGVRQK